MLDVVVVGAGVGGLACAAALGRSPVARCVRLVERVARPTPAGSGLVLQPVGGAALRRAANIEPDQLGAPLSALRGRTASRPVLDAEYARAAPARGVHRGALHSALLDALPSRVELRTGHAVRHVGELGRTPDLVVDASGVHSPFVPPDMAHPLPFGALWATVALPDWYDTRDVLEQRYFRASHMAGLLPVGRVPGRPQDVFHATVFWSLRVADHQNWTNQPLNEFYDQVEQLWPEMATIVRGQLTRDDWVFAQYSHGMLDSPVSLIDKVPVVHIGDAAHRASPQLGQGANMALLDAVALVNELEKMNSIADLKPALEKYATARRFHTRLYQTMSAFFTPLFQSESHAPAILRDTLYPFSRVPPMPSVLTKLVSGNLVRPFPDFSDQAKQ